MRSNLPIPRTSLYFPRAMVATNLADMLNDKMSFPDMLRLIVRYLPDEQDTIYKTNQMYIADLLKEDMKKGMEFDGFSHRNPNRR